ncbi:MAG: hypothetical protein OJF50_004877 [Nitrospira sp.]|jgi:hypothetical protein|nr:hypothetical protein [Nitrospira sp.]
MFEMFNQDAGMPFDVYDFSLKPAFGLLNLLAKPTFEGFSSSSDNLFDLRQGFLIHSMSSNRRYSR